MATANIGTTFDKQAKIWYGPAPSPPLFNTDCSLGRILFYMMKLKQKSVALYSDSENTSVTYEELLTNSIRIAQHLQNLAPSQDDIVGVVSGHIAHVTSILCASWFNATAVHPINPAHEKDVVQHLFSKTRPKVIFCEGKYYQKVLKSCQALKLESPIYTINDHIEGVRSILELIMPTSMEQSYVPKDLLYGGDQTMCIINSSGTTGLPKAVCKSNASLFAWNLVKENDVSFVISPLDWLSAIIFTVTSITTGSKRVITSAPFTPEYVLALMKKYKITTVLFCPSYLAHLLTMPDIKECISSLTTLYCGGAIMPVATFKKYHSLLRSEQTFGIGYGCSEFPSSIAFNFNTDKPSAVGQIVPGVKVKIVADDGRQLGVGETGEILAHDGKVWKGYYNDPKATHEMCDNELWFHTGDLGYFDEDGDLFVVDRKKDVMKYRGVHYTPQEIEQVIAQLPDVVQVCVFGNTNDLDGDRPAAAIVKKRGSKLTEEEVVQYVAERFEVEWKRLHGGVYFMDTLPITGSGKIIRSETKMIALQC